MDTVEIETDDFRCPHCDELLLIWSKPFAGRCPHTVYGLFKGGGDEDALLYAREDFAPRILAALRQASREAEHDEGPEQLTAELEARFLQGDCEPGDTISMRAAPAVALAKGSC